MSKVALVGAILLCVVQLIDLVWYMLEIKCKDCKNVKQVFCKCRDIEILNEWEGIDTKFGKCIKCGKYFMIDDRTNIMVHISENEYNHHVKMFNMLDESKKNIEESMKELNFDDVLMALKNTFENDTKDKENKE